MAKGKTVTPPEMSCCQKVVDKFKRSQAVMIGTDSVTGEITISSYGIDKKNKEEAAKAVLLIKNILMIKWV